MKPAWPPQRRQRQSHDPRQKSPMNWFARQAWPTSPRSSPPAFYCKRAGYSAFERGSSRASGWSAPTRSPIDAWEKWGGRQARIRRRGIWRVFRRQRSPERSCRDPVLTHAIASGSASVQGARDLDPARM